MVVSRLAMSALLFYYAVYRDKLFLPIRQWRDNALASWREILKIGLPAMATQMIGPISGAIITRMLASHGHDVVAGFGVAGRIEGVAVMLLFALSGSIGPFVGQNWGAGNLERVHGGIRVAYRFSLAWGAAAWLVLMLIGDWVVPLIDDNAEVIDVARHYLAIVPISYGLWGVLMMASAAFNSLGKPIPSTIMAFTRMFVVYVPLALIADHLFGYSGHLRCDRNGELPDGTMGLFVAETFTDRVDRWQPRSGLIHCAAYGRRLVTVPLYLALTALATLALPLLAPLCWLVSLRAATRGALRSGAFMLAYLWCESIGIVCSGWLWIRNGFPTRSSARWQRFLAGNFALQCWWANALKRAAERLFRLSFTVEGSDALDGAPVIMLPRHASIADTIIPMVFYAAPHQVRLRYVLKRELLLDPCLDIVGNRLPNCFVARSGTDAQDDIDKVVELTRDRASDEGFLIYPEGTRFSAERRRTRARFARHARCPRQRCSGCRNGPTCCRREQAARAH